MEKKRILVVDDEPATRQVLASLLGDSFDVTLAADGREGIVAAEAILPDLILTDVNMPGLDGYSMVRHIHATLGNKLPVIFLTVRDTPLDVVIAINEGARSFVHKPIDYVDLEAKIRRVLHMK